MFEKECFYILLNFTLPIVPSARPPCFDLMLNKLSREKVKISFSKIIALKQSLTQ